MANTKIDRIKLNGSDTVYDIDLPTDATPSISSLTIANGLTGNGSFAWSKTAYGETGTTQIADGCRLLLTSGYSTPSIDFSEPRNTTMPYLSSITTTSISFANDSIYPSILWHSNIPNMSGKPFFLTSDLLGKRNYIAQLDNTGKIPAAQIPNNYLDKGTSSTTATQTVYNPVELKKALTAPSLTVSDIKNAAMVSTDANGKLTKSNLPDTFEQISVVEATVQYNDNIEVTEVYLQCEGMESSYRWSKIVFPAPGSYAASTVKYYYNYMGQKTELTPTNASDLNSALVYAGEHLTVSISNDASNPTITYLPHGMILDRCYCSTDEGRTKITYYSYNALTGMPALHEIAPDTSTFLDKGTASTTATQTVYNPVELKKALVVPSIQSTKYTDKFGNQQPLFELGGTHSVNNDVSSGYGSLTLYRDRDGTWDSTSIAYTLGEGLKIGDYGIGGPLSNNGTHSTNYLMTNKDGIAKTSFNGINITSTLTNTDDFVFESAGNGKLHSKMSSDSNGLVRGGWCIDDKKIATIDVVRSTRDALAEHITAQAGGWIWLGKVAEKTYSLDLSEIKPGESGTTKGATCCVSINTFQQTIEGATQYKTIIDATCRCEPFELRPFLLSNVGSKWFMPRMLIFPDMMQSNAFDHMMAVLYADRIGVGMTVDECSIFRDMTTALGTLNESGSVSPIYGMNADGFSLFATIMELDRANEKQSILVSGAHYRVTIFHPHNVL